MVDGDDGFGVEAGGGSVAVESDSARVAWQPPEGTEDLPDSVCERVLTKLELESWVLFRKSRNVSAVSRATNRSRQAVQKSLRRGGEKLAAVVAGEAVVPLRVEERLPLMADAVPARVTNEWMIEQWERVGATALLQLTPENLRLTQPKDLAAIADRATEKAQLLKGLPTQRVAHEDRQKLDEVMVMLVEEIKRRGKEIDITPSGEVQIRSLEAVNS